MDLEEERNNNWNCEDTGEHCSCFEECTEEDITWCCYCGTTNKESDVE